MLKNLENNGMEEIDLITPTPGAILDNIGQIREDNLAQYLVIWERFRMQAVSWLGGFLNTLEFVPHFQEV